MNERIKEIMFKAGIVAMNADHVVFEKLQLEHFAELVRQDERELCAKLCDPYTHGQWFAKAIRARGEK